MVRVKTNVKIIKLVMIETVGDYMQVFYYGLRFFVVSASNRLGRHAMDNNRDRRLSLQWKRKRPKRIERRRRNKCFEKNKNKKPNFECSERLTKWNWIRVIQRSFWASIELRRLNIYIYMNDSRANESNECFAVRKNIAATSWSSMILFWTNDLRKVAHEKNECQSTR